MIYSYTNCRCKGTFIYPDYSSVQLFYLGDKKVCLSITNAITCPSLTKNKRAGFSLGNPHIGHSLFTLMMENKWIFLFIEMLAPENDFAKAIKTKPKHIKMFIWSCVFWYLKIPWRWKYSLNLHQEPGKVIILIQQKSALDSNLHVVEFPDPLQLLDPQEGQLVQRLHLRLHLCLADVDELYTWTCSWTSDGKVLGRLHNCLPRQHLGHDTWGWGGCEIWNMGRGNLFPPLFALPPMPSTAPLPCEVAKKS